MINVSVSPPTIAQTLMAINNPQPNINVGTADPEASAAAIGTVEAGSSGSVGTCCGSSVDTYA